MIHLSELNCGTLSIAVMGVAKNTLSVDLHGTGLTAVVNFMAKSTVRQKGLFQLTAVVYKRGKSGQEFKTKTWRQQLKQKP